MEQNEINELHAILENYVREKGLKVSEALSFLTTTFVGTMVIHGYTEDFFDKTCERMKQHFKEKKDQLGL